MSLYAVDIVDQESIRPSTPTPPHLSTVNFSIMDQHELPLYIYQLLFYTAATGDSVVRRLKKSLSETLTLFYPFAGRIVDNKYIHCNDRGVNFFETRARTQMEEVLTNPATDSLAQLLPDIDKADPTALMSAQVNVFDCGRVAIGFCLTHQISDPSSIAYFLNSWAAQTRGAAHEIVPPVFRAAELFPPIKGDIEAINAPPEANTVKTVNKRFVFSASNIAALQAKCSTKSFRPSRVVAVMAYIWKCSMNASRSTSSAVMIPMNLRTRMEPPLSSAYVGNLILGLLSTSTPDRPRDMAYLAAQLQSSIGRVDREYVKGLQVDHGVLKVHESHQRVLSELYSSSQGGQVISLSGITTFCRFPIYGADFGWGKPEWVTFVNLRCPDITMLMDTKCGTGIQACITLTEEVMSRFECSPDVITPFSSSSSSSSKL